MGKGIEKAKKAAFRECFFRIGEVRLLPLGTPILALTATATDEIVKDTLVRFGYENWDTSFLKAQIAQTSTLQGNGQQGLNECICMAYWYHKDGGQ